MKLKYDWHNAENAEVPCCCVYRVDDDYNQETQEGDMEAYTVAVFYFNDGEDPEQMAIDLATALNAKHGIVANFGKTTTQTWLEKLRNWLLGEMNTRPGYAVDQIRAELDVATGAATGSTGGAS